MNTLKVIQIYNKYALPVMYTKKRKIIFLIVWVARDVMKGDADGFC